MLMQQKIPTIITQGTQNVIKKYHSNKCLNVCRAVKYMDNVRVGLVRRARVDVVLENIADVEVLSERKTGVSVVGLCSSWVKLCSD